MFELGIFMVGCCFILLAAFVIYRNKAESWSIPPVAQCIFILICTFAIFYAPDKVVKSFLLVKENSTLKGKLVVVSKDKLDLEEKLIKANGDAVILAQKTKETNSKLITFVSGKLNNLEQQIIKKQYKRWPINPHETHSSNEESASPYEYEVHPSTYKEENASLIATVETGGSKKLEWLEDWISNVRQELDLGPRFTWVDAINRNKVIRTNMYHHDVVEAISENIVKVKILNDKSTIELDISEEACKPFGFLHNERVRTPNGTDATVIGVAKSEEGGDAPQLWFLVDGDNGVMHWRDFKTIEDFGNAGFVLIH